MRQVAGEDGWTNLFGQSGVPKFACGSCGEQLELLDFTAIVCAILIGVVAILAVVFYDTHFFWLLVELFTHPVRSFELIAADGPLAVIIFPLILVMIVFLLVILPVMSLGWALWSLWLRFNHPKVVGSALGAGDREQQPTQQKMKKRTTFLRAVFLGVGFNVLLGVALLLIFALNGGRSAVEDLMETVLPPAFLASGLLFGVQRWIVGVVAFLCLPLTSYLVFLAQ